MKRFFLCLILHTATSCPTSLSDLTLDQKIGQLFMIAAVSNTDLNKAFMAQSPYTMNPNYVEAMIRNYHVGGVIFLGGGLIQEQIAMTKRFQQASDIPLLIGQDFEWGLSMRLQDALRFPHAMTLGALSEENDYLIYEMGEEIGKQCSALGVHINLAPVADVNNNPKNPIIHDRSFGEDPNLVARKATYFSQGLQSAGTLSCAKHFPGHGDTGTDSHLSLPLISHNKKRLDAVELLPFRSLIKKGVDAIMTAHLAVPALTEAKTVPTSLSKKVVTDLLRKKYKFNGLIVTDGLGMRGVTLHYAPGTLELLALLAGNDLLIAPVEIEQAIFHIKSALAAGTLSEDEIDSHVARILAAKKHISRPKQRYNFHNKRALALKKTLYRNAITLVKNENALLPLDSKKYDIRLTFIGDDKNEMLFREHFSQGNNGRESVHIIVVSGINKQAMIELQHEEKDNGHSKLQKTIEKIRGKKIVVLLGSPYALPAFVKADAIIVAYEEDIDAQQGAIDAIRGMLNPQGQLPVTASAEFHAGLGLSFS
jgi:beta-glucosidase-like glycosyl hydrolase